MSYIFRRYRFVTAKERFHVPGRPHTATAIVSYLSYFRKPSSGKLPGGYTSLVNCLTRPVLRYHKQARYSQKGEYIPYAPGYCSTTFQPLFSQPPRIRNKASQSNYIYIPDTYLHIQVKQLGGIYTYSRATSDRNLDALTW